MCTNMGLVTSFKMDFDYCDTVEARGANYIDKDGCETVKFTGYLTRVQGFTTKEHLVQAVIFENEEGKVFQLGEIDDDSLEELTEEIGGRIVGMNYS